MSKILEFVNRANPIVTSVSLAFGAYWFLNWFRTLQQFDYILIVVIALVAYYLIESGAIDND
jgi:hypothetical protein